MNTNALSNLLAGAILAGGELGEEENTLIADIESDMELPGLADHVKQRLAAIGGYDDEKLADEFNQSADEIDVEDRPQVFEALISVTLADGVIREDEIANILTIAEALEIPIETAVARLLFQVQESDGEVIVDVEEELTDFIVVGGRTRYTGWDAFVRMLKQEKGYSDAFVATLQTIKDQAEKTFGDQLVLNYTPNFLTLACKEPVSRSRTFCYVWLKKKYVRVEFAGNTFDITAPEQYTAAIHEGVRANFNKWSKVQR